MTTQTQLPVGTFTGHSLRNSTVELYGSGEKPEEIPGDGIRSHLFFIRVPTFVYLIITTYFAAMLTVVERKRRKTGGQLNTPYWIAARLFAAWFCALAYLCCIGTLIFEGALQNTCDALIKFENGLYWVTLSSIYAAIWFRQRLIYKNYAQREGRSKCAFCLSWFGAVLIIVLPILNSLLLAFGVTFGVDGHCEHVCAPMAELFAPIEVIGPLTMQFILLGLFAWPLYRHHRNINHTIPRSTRSLMRRLILATLGCAVTDMSCSVGSYFMPVFLRFFSQQTSTFFNLLFLILSFRNWRNLLAPWRGASSRRGSSATPAMSSAKSSQ